MSVIRPLHCSLYLYENQKSRVCVRVPILRVAERYGTIAAHTRRRASFLVVFVVLCMHMHSFAGLIRRTPPPTFSDTSVTLIPLFTSSELTGCGYPGLWIGKIVRTCAPGGSRTLDFLRARRAPYPLDQALYYYVIFIFIYDRQCSEHTTNLIYESVYDFC